MAEPNEESIPIRMPSRFAILDWMGMSFGAAMRGGYIFRPGDDTVTVESRASGGGFVEDEVPDVVAKK